MRIGKSFVEELTRRAVDTEFGRGYRGVRLLRTRGESGLEVRRRIERWKERVERAQRITVDVNECSGKVKGLHTEKEILDDYGLLGEAEEIAVVCFVCGGCGGSLLFDSCPG
jgi:hypothetical protein